MSIKDLIWYEKHRPKKISQLALPKNYKTAFKKYIKTKEIPHLLFYGPAGSGKTTIATILVNAIASGKLILNASSEDRGVATVKKKIKQFASARRMNEEKLNIVFLDEAHGLTLDAQEALKNTIEVYQSNCRFIFTCNQIDKMIEPIISRCMLYKFDSLPRKKLLRYLTKILNAEGVDYKEKDVVEIVDRFYPDVRTIINNLQSCASTTNTLDITKAIDSFDTELIKIYLKEGAIFALRNTWNHASDFVWLYRYLFNKFIPEEMDDDVKADAAIITAEYLYRDRTVADKEINMAGLCLELMNLMEVKIDFQIPF